MDFKRLAKLKPGDKVAILSPSFAAPGRWPHIYEYGLRRLVDRFNLVPVAYPTTSKIGASGVERSADLIAAFENPEIKAIITTLGGDDQVTYVKNLPSEPFAANPKPFFGFSDNTHLANHLWFAGVPSFYGGALFTQFAQMPEIDPFTEEFLRIALFEEGNMELRAADKLNDEGVSWDEADVMTRPKKWEDNEGWIWDGSGAAKGYTWGGCVESVDELLRHAVRIPSFEQFSEVVLLLETSEEMPTAAYVKRVIRAFGELGILERIRALLVGRPKAWEFDKQSTLAEKMAYRAAQREAVLAAFRAYNKTAPVVQNLDFGHSNPQICIPYGGLAEIDADLKKISIHF